MLRWCSYCQEFQGEAPSYSDMSFTHGLCEACASVVLDLTERDLTRARMLASFQERLKEAGSTGSLAAAEQVIAAAAVADLRPVDVLVGVIAPALYDFAEALKGGEMSAAADHRFTAFCEYIFDRVAAGVAAKRAGEGQHSRPSDILVVNAGQGGHTLGIRILSLWLVGKSLHPRVIDRAPTPADLAAVVSRERPSFVLVSIALAEDRSGVVGFVEQLGALPDEVRPRIIVGGYAVKAGLIDLIPGAEFVADIRDLDLSSNRMSALLAAAIRTAD